MAKNALVKVSKSGQIKPTKKKAKTSAPKKAENGLTAGNVATQLIAHVALVGAKNLAPAEIMGKSSAYFIELPAALVAAGAYFFGGKKTAAKATHGALGIGHAFISRLDSSRAIAVVVGKGGEVSSIDAKGNVTEVSTKKAS